MSSTSRRLLEAHLEFDAADAYAIGDNQQPIQTYLLQGEHRTEALTFLPDGSANRSMIWTQNGVSKIDSNVEKPLPRKGTIRRGNRRSWNRKIPFGL